jgi:hypothetical protein
MKIRKQLRQYVGRRNARRIYKAIPWVGGGVALAALNSTVGRRMLNDLKAVDALPWREAAGGTAMDRSESIPSATTR